MHRNRLTEEWLGNRLLVGKTDMEEEFCCRVTERVMVGLSIGLGQRKDGCLNYPGFM